MKYLFSAALASVLLVTAPVFAQQGGALQAPPNAQQQPRRTATTPAKPVAAKPTPNAANSLPTGTKTIDNWVYSCALQPGPDNQQVKGCNMRSNFVVEDQDSKQKSVAAGIVIGRMMAEKQPQMLLQLPLSALLVEPPRILSSDGNPVVELAWVACTPQFCIANATLADAQVAALVNIGATLSVAYRNQAGQQIKVDGSVKGIDVALNALSREK